MFIRSHAGIRGVLALLVLPLHLNFELLYDEYAYFSKRLFIGSFAVDIFFLLSGFIICKLYFGKLGGRKEIRSFFMARFARVLPLHYATLLVVGCMAILGSMIGVEGGDDYRFTHLLKQLFLVQSWPVVRIAPWVTTSWSLSMEMLAYLFTPLILLGVKSLLKLSAVKRLLLSLLLVGLTPFVYELGYLMGVGPAGGWVGVGRVLLCYIAGAILATLAQEKFRFLSSKFWRVRFIDALSLLVVGLYVITFTLELVHPGLLYCFAGLWIFGSSFDLPSVTTSLFGSKIGLFLGEISYSIYLIHPIIGKIVHVFYGKANFIPSLGWVALSLLAVFVLSILSYYCLEKPARTWIRALASKKG